MKHSSDPCTNHPPPRKPDFELSDLRIIKNDERFDISGAYRFLKLTKL